MEIGKKGSGETLTFDISNTRFGKKNSVERSFYVILWNKIYEAHNRMDVKQHLRVTRVREGQWWRDLGWEPRGVFCLFASSRARRTLCINICNRNARRGIVGDKRSIERRQRGRTAGSPNDGARGKTMAWDGPKENWSVQRGRSVEKSFPKLRSCY